MPACYHFLYPVSKRTPKVNTYTFGSNLYTMR